MNSLPQDQKEPSPNFDFIIKTGGTTTHKGPNKKALLLIVLAIITLIILIVGAFLSSRENVVPEAPTYQGPPVSKQEAEPVIKDFLTLVQQGNYDAAYAHVAESEDNIFTKEAFLNQAVPVLDTLILDECILAQESPSDHVVVFGCSAKEGSLVINLEFTMINQDGQIKIVYYTLGQVA